MSMVAAVAGAAFMARPIRTAKVAASVLSGTCTAVGAVTISGVGFGLLPYMAARAPLRRDQRAALLEDFRALVGPPEPQMVDGYEEDRRQWPPKLCFHDLQRPWLFLAFTEAARTIFALYADATGVMTPTEFRCALHKMVDIALSWYGLRSGAVTPEVQAASVRKLLERVADGAFRVIDEDGDGAVDACEFTGAVLLVLAVANGQALVEAPVLRRLAFRVVDADGDGVVEERELLRWVELALQYGTAPPGAQQEPRGPWGLFGTRTLTPANLAKKWLRGADADGDGALSPAEFAQLAPALRVHEVIRHMARRFAV